jgi:hypothetical protein
MTSVTVQLPPDTEQKLRHRASLLGQSLEAYLEGLAEREASALNGVPGRPPEPRTFDQLTGPISQAVQASGLSPEEVDAFLDEAVRERRAERRSPPGQAP